MLQTSALATQQYVSSAHHAHTLRMPQVDGIMEELLRENLSLMDRVAALADEREVWRQTAESAALPGCVATYRFIIAHCVFS